MKQKLDTRAMGLDTGLAFIKWLTGAENLHYGYWHGLEVNAANVGAAQAAYTDKLFKLLPDQGVRILDIGGGAGETARKLIKLGHEVEIVVPSPFLAERCRANAPDAIVHEMMFEDFDTDKTFDICLFSESFQYIPLNVGLAKCLTFLTDNGEIIVADCFRTDAYTTAKKQRSLVGGGHWIKFFRETLDAEPLEVVSEEDITEQTAPSVEIEQGMFNVIGYGITRINEELAEKRPMIRRVLNGLVNLTLSKRRRIRLAQRMFEQTRNRAVFSEYNVYLMMKLRRKPA